MAPVHLDEPPAIKHDAAVRGPDATRRTGVIAAVGALIAISVVLPSTGLSKLTSINTAAAPPPPSTSSPPAPLTTGSPLPVVAAGPTTSSTARNDPGVHSSGSVRLSTHGTLGLSLRSEENWFRSFTADLTVTHGVLAAGNGAGITRMDSQPHPAECEHKNNAGPYVLGPQLPSGTEFCIKTHDGLFGRFRVDYELSSDDKIDDVLISGAVWRSR